MEQPDITNDPDYRAGYAAMLRLRGYAERAGWPIPPPRRLISEIFWLERSAANAQHTPGRVLEMLDQPLYAAAWYRGRAAALRELLRESRTPSDEA